MFIYFNDKLIADNIILSDTFLKRFVGLMGKKELNAGEGMLLYDCSSIHSFFMRIPIDAVYLSGDLRVLKVETLKPWRMGSLVKGAKHVLELSAGAVSGILNIGDFLKITETN